MCMILRGKNLEYVVEGGYEEWFNGTTSILPDTAIRTDNHLVSSIITSRVNQENYVTISPCQHSARLIWRALLSAHQNSTTRGSYMHLHSMMSQQVLSDNDVSKLIDAMDVLRQQLLNVCPEGTVSFNDLFISSLIPALLDDWTSVTAPLKLQATVTPIELKNVLWGHLNKLKNWESMLVAAWSAALSTTFSSKRNKSNTTPPPPECTYCKM